MKVYIEPIGRLINEFSKLPGVGAKTAQRFAYKIVNMPENEAKNFAEAILNVKKNVRYCTICGNFAEEDVCGTDRYCCCYDRAGGCVLLAVLRKAEKGRHCRGVPRKMEDNVPYCKDHHGSFFGADHSAGGGGDDGRRSDGGF